MWLSPAQAGAIAEACGLVPAPPGTQGSHRLEIRIEPLAAAIRLELSGGKRPAAGVDVRPGDTIREPDARALLAGGGLASGSGDFVARLLDAFCRYEMLSLEVGIAGPDLRLTGVRALCDENAAFRNAQVRELLESTQPEATRRLKALGIEYVELDG